ncbi:MAG: hypothetical protein JJT78_08610 [Leptospira sp.]|nr:hypothetical protein [Leptospira sp.]
MLRSFNFSIYLLIFIFIVYCKESKTGTGYIKQDKSMNAKAYVMDDVCIFKTPKLAHPCESKIPANAEVRVTQHSIDPLESETRKIKFYEVEWKGIKGYVSYQEELDTKNFYTIVPLSEPVKVKVNVASLRFRKLPSLKAENIRPLLR